MELKLVRLYKKSEYTIGKLYIDGVYFCDTVEDTDRGLTQSMSEEKILAIKAYGKTAIPTGRYRVTLTYSNKFKRVLPLVNAVKGFLGIRMHNGKDANSSLGCIIVGENKTKGGVINSRATMERLMAKLRGQKDIFITIE